MAMAAIRVLGPVEVVGGDGPVPLATKPCCLLAALLVADGDSRTPDELVEALLEIRNGVSVPVEFVARSHLPMLEYEAQVEVMQQLAEDVAPHV